eukprot:scpid79247/ scgid9862/ 
MIRAHHTCTRYEQLLSQCTVASPKQWYLYLSGRIKMEALARGQLLSNLTCCRQTAPTQAKPSSLRRTLQLRACACCSSNSLTRAGRALANLRQQHLYQQQRRV